MIPFHPAANAFPMLDKARLESLKADIQTNGLRVPIVLCDGLILDGRNRATVCEQLGITPATTTFTGDPWAYVWSLNGQRRDLSADQRAQIWLFCNEHSEAWKKEQARIAEEANRKRSVAAKERPRDDGGKFETAEQPVVEQSVPLLATPPDRHKSKNAKAQQAEVNAGAIARAAALAKARPDLAEKVRTGEVKPAEARRQAKKDEIARKVYLPQDKFRVILADPPWSYGNTQPDYHIEQRDHYPVMSITDIGALPVADITEPDAVLFLWVTSPILEESFQVIKAWGFKYKASFVWDKIKHNMGHYNSVRHEFLLICTKGSCQPDNRKLMDSVVSIERQEHSKKPEEFYDIIETLYPHGKRIELFARNARAGWEAYGYES